MSLYQCDKCGCKENTACGSYHGKSEKLCSACAPKSESTYGKKFGQWHGVFERVFFEKGMYVTNSVGNLEHKETGEPATLLTGSLVELNNDQD